MRRTLSIFGPLLAALLAAGALAAPGCAGIPSHMMWWMKLDRRPAEYPGLEGKQVAVYVESPQSSFGLDVESDMLAREIGTQLRYSVPKIDVVQQDEVAAWIDAHGSRQVDYRALGKGLKVERVVVVKLNSPLVYHENSTLYQGKADYTVTVYNAADGKAPYSSRCPEFIFPKRGGVSTMEMSEAKFRLEFIKWLGDDITRRFHANDLPRELEAEPRIE